MAIKTLILFLAAFLIIAIFTRECFGRGVGPVRVAITDSQQQTWINAHNNLRRSVQADNMECIVAWSSELESIAQTVSNYCVTRNPTTSTITDPGFCYTNVGIATYISVGNNSTLPTPTEVLNSWKNQGDTYYDAVNNVCTAPEPTLSTWLTCDNYKQAFSASLSEVGCAITRCSYVDAASYTETCRGCNPLAQGYVITCAYDQIATTPPYTLGFSCQNCPSYKNTCSIGLCCGVDSQCSLSKTIFRRYSGTVNDHFYTTTIYEAQKVLSEGYNDEGTFGTCWSSASDPTCPTLTPMYRLYNPTLADHFYTTNYTQMLQAQNNFGYSFERIEFYCVPSESNVCGATVPVNRYWSGGAKDHLYVGTRKNYFGYRFEVTECYIAPP